MVYNTKDSYCIREPMFYEINSRNLSDRIFNLLYYDNDLMLVYNMNDKNFIINDKREEKLIITYKLNLTEFKKFLSWFKDLRFEFDDMDMCMNECDLMVRV